MAAESEHGSEGCFSLQVTCSKGKTMWKLNKSLETIAPPNSTTFMASTPLCVCVCV